MRIVRLYDPARTPPGWMQIIQPSEFAGFVTHADSGATCDAEGEPTSEESALCILFPTLGEAEAFCRERVLQRPILRFDIRDAGGLLRAPLFTIVHPSRAEQLDGSPSRLRRNRIIGTALLVTGPLLIWFDWAFYDSLMIMPTFVGINALLIAARIFIMNRGILSAERNRLDRVAQAQRRDTAVS